MFHSAPSRSSIDTKVGSPPIVRRTSPAVRSASTFSPSASSFCQAASENGLVMRGASRTRVTDISKPNSTSAKPAMPEIGAAERKCGVAATGICPSPVSMPEVASKPIQPAPGI